MRISTGNFDSIFFLGVTPFLNLEIWPKWKILLKQFVSTTPLKPLKRTSWNFVVMKDLMCRCAYPQEFWFFFFLGVTPLFKLGNLTNIKILLETRQRNYTETAQQNFVKLCSYEGHNFFKEQFISLLKFWPKLFCATKMNLVFFRLPVTYA